MKTKEERIEELNRKIEEIKNEPETIFILIKVIPDCGAGICDEKIKLAVAESKELLIDFCLKEYSISPVLEDKCPHTKDFCKPWYYIGVSTLRIIN